MSYQKRSSKMLNKKSNRRKEPKDEEYYMQPSLLAEAISLIAEARKKKYRRKEQEKKNKKSNLVTNMCNHPSELVGAMDALHIKESSNVLLLQNFRLSVVSGNWAAAATILRFMSSMYRTFSPFIYKASLMIFMYHNEAAPSHLDHFLESIIGLRHNAEKKIFLEKAVKWNNNERIMFMEEGPSYFDLQETVASEDDDEDITKLLF